MADFENDCSDFNRPERCPFGIGTHSTLCEFFEAAETFPQDGYIAASFQRIYVSLRNMFLAAPQARDELISEGFVDDMVKNLQRQKTPIPRSALSS